MSFLSDYIDQDVTRWRPKYLPVKTGMLVLTVFCLLSPRCSLGDSLQLRPDWVDNYADGFVGARGTSDGVLCQYWYQLSSDRKTIDPSSRVFAKQRVGPYGMWEGGFALSKPQGDIVAYSVYKRDDDDTFFFWGLDRSAKTVYNFVFPGLSDEAEGLRDRGIATLDGGFTTLFVLSSSKRIFAVNLGTGDLYSSAILSFDARSAVIWSSDGHDLPLAVGPESSSVVGDPIPRMLPATVFLMSLNHQDSSLEISASEEISLPYETFNPRSARCLDDRSLLLTWIGWIGTEARDAQSPEYEVMISAWEIDWGNKTVDQLATLLTDNVGFLHFPRGNCVLIRDDSIQLVEYDREKQEFTVLSEIPRDNLDTHSVWEPTMEVLLREGRDDKTVPRIWSPPNQTTQIVPFPDSSMGFRELTIPIPDQ